MPVIEQTKTPTKTVFGNILVATDFSEPSRRALAGAVAIAIHDNAHLSLVHVIPRNPQYLSLENPPELDVDRIEAEAHMTTFLGTMELTHNIAQTYLLQGDAPTIVASLIESKDIDLLVVGTHGRGGFQKLALGSVAEEVLRLAACPVLTIGPKVAVMPTGAKFQQILYATDFGKSAAKALPLALALVRAYGAKLTLMHLLPAMPSSSGNLSAFPPGAAGADELIEWENAARKEGMRRLRESIPQGTELTQEPEFLLETDFLPEGILSAAAKRRVDLIVMGANRGFSARAAAHFPWSLVHEVVRDATCPVLTVCD